MKKLAIAASSVALAAMPVVGVFADPAADQQATDTIQITVDGSCSFTTGSGIATYAAQGGVGESVQPKNGGTNEHEFTVFCNDNDGYKVSATAQALNQSPSISANFAYVNSLPSGATGAWNALISQESGGSLTLDQLPTGGAATDIVTKSGASVTGGETFKATYTAYIGTATPAGIYSGTIAYTLSAQ